MLKLLSKRIKSSVLSYIIMLSIVILVVCLSFLLVHEEFEYRYHNLLINNRINDNINSAIVLINSGYDIVENEEVKLKLFNSLDDTLSINKRRWGVYDLVTINFSVSNSRIQKIGLWGNSYNYNNDPSLFISNSSNSITLGKNVSLSGKLVVPGGVLKSDFGYFSSKEAKVENSRYQVDEVLFRKYSFDLPSISDTILIVDDIMKLKTVYNNSFFNKTIYIKMNGRVSLDNISIIGNVLIYSDNTIVVKKSCHIDNAILRAKRILVEDNFKGRMQIIAEDTIEVGNNVSMKYPSALICYAKENSEINIMDNVTISGSIVFINDEINDKNRGLVKMSNKSTVYGLIFSNSNIDCKGSIIGALYCNRLLSYRKSMFYENYIDSVFLNNKILPSYFAMPTILNCNRKKMICWLK